MKLGGTKTSITIIQIWCKMQPIKNLAIFNGIFSFDVFLNAFLTISKTLQPLSCICVWISGKIECYVTATEVWYCNYKKSSICRAIK